MLKAAVVPEERAKLTVATAHKSKGIEWQHVNLTNNFIELPPLKNKEFDPEEINLLYVAVTLTREERGAAVQPCRMDAEILGAAE
ncbi:3'-5' exonuclease [Burkholderia pseudomallei]|uniref:3'-5' exonuclease n=1 Tax=Burkholderia pseudomallei TaxID=28450 RepID=UPI00016AD224|nr:3'-5' exonuclease [Burkholderia pseudomallei]ARK63225.1 hypothetical protein BOC37_26120 [Burkholderia pseudomallei]ARK68494.1 hypothetical protein BOC38_18640 [Burkholderia pseudomallei]ARK77756.1 hypothetical protein BOC39_31170 [Burkholderia pseudomallei]ARL02184.1 hypothetical protein BOC44_10855 [Burkholderia pseudomallei]ARL05140.1 hypothetical protein BOC44_26230 [Burkholderia pseudomallei]